MFNGIKEVVLDDNKLASFYEGRYEIDMLTNQYLLIKNKDLVPVDKLRYNGKSFDKLCPIRFNDLKPRTIKQEFYLDLLANKNIPIKIASGVPGSGKTRLAVKHGMYFLEKGWVNKIFIIRHNVSIGEKNGYLKGTKEEKICGWLGCISDNLHDCQWTLDELIKLEKIEVEGVEYIKGRDIKNAWIIVDESEDLTEEQFKVVGERVSEGSYICFIGDCEQTSQEKYKKHNGLKRAINNLAGDSLVGIVGFDDKEHDNVRSKVSKVFSYKY